MEVPLANERRTAIRADAPLLGVHLRKQRHELEKNICGPRCVHKCVGFSGGAVVKNPPAMQELQET